MDNFIAEYEAWLKQRRRGAYTIEQYVSLLRRIERGIPVGVVDATVDELIDWIYTDGRSETTYAHYTVIVQGFGKWLVATGRLDFHASDELPEAHPDSAEIRPATEDEFADIQARAVEPWRDLYELAGRAGLRAVEIHRLHREHIGQAEIRVYGKGGKWRAIPCHPALWERFQGRPSGPVARGLDGLPLSRAQVIRRGNYYLDKMGLDVRMHQLRKRFATRAYQQSGHDIRLVQELLGHALVSTTQKYIGVDRKQAAAVVTGL